MNPTEFFIVLGTIYIAPHVPKLVGIFIGVSFIAGAVTGIFLRGEA